MIEPKNVKTTCLGCLSVLHRDNWQDPAFHAAGCPVFDTPEQMLNQFVVAALRGPGPAGGRQDPS